MPDPTELAISAEMKQCIQNCTNCHNICVETTVYCIEMGGNHADSAHLETLLDCAETCRFSAEFMLRNSSLHPKICGVCAEACELCAESCVEFGDDAQMLACAEECRRCMESCRQMANV